MIFCWLEAMPSDFAENILARKKIENKAWYTILGTETLSYEEFHCKAAQISEEIELYLAQWK